MFRHPHKLKFSSKFIALLKFSCQVLSSNNESKNAGLTYHFRSKNLSFVPSNFQNVRQFVIWAYAESDAASSPAFRNGISQVVFRPAT